MDVTIPNLPQPEKYINGLVNSMTQTPLSTIPAAKAALYEKYQKTEKKLQDKFMKNRDEIERTEKRARENSGRIQTVQNKILHRFGQSLTQAELLTIARFVSDKYHIKIDRDAIRRKKGLLAWCSENMDQFLDVLSQTTGVHVEEKAS